MLWTWTLVKSWKSTALPAVPLCPVQGGFAGMGGVPGKIGLPPVISCYHPHFKKWDVPLGHQRSSHIEDGGMCLGLDFTVLKAGQAMLSRCGFFVKGPQGAGINGLFKMLIQCERESMGNYVEMMLIFWVIYFDFMVTSWDFAAASWRPSGLRDSPYVGWPLGVPLYRWMVYFG